MSVWNVFTSDAFSMVSLTANINKLPYKPGQLGQLGIFEEAGISTTTAVIEEKNGVLSLVDVAPRNAPGQVVNGAHRAVRSFVIPHMPERATIMADEVQGVRAFGSESSAQAIAVKINERLASMRGNLEYTLESHRLSALMGNYIDSNGSSVALSTAFNVSAASTVSAFAAGGSKVRVKCSAAIKAVEAGLGGMPYTGITVLCGPDFWDALIGHKDLTDVVMGWQAAETLRNSPMDPFTYGGIRFIRYRGTSQVKIGDNDAWAFPTGVSGLFLTRFAPANYLETVNTLGLPFYAKSQPLPMDKGVAMEAQSNALNLCTRPNAVVKLVHN